MLASELVDQLTDAIAARGDFPVEICDVVTGKFMPLYLIVYGRRSIKFGVDCSEAEQNDE